MILLVVYKVASDILFLKLTPTTICPVNVHVKMNFSIFFSFFKIILLKVKASVLPS